MNDTVTDVEVAEDYVVAGETLYTVGKTLTATQARDLFARHGVKVKFRCIPCKQPLRVDALGGKIRSPYFRKAEDNTGHLHHALCRFSRDEQTSQGAAGGGERPRPSMPTALVAPPGYSTGSGATAGNGHPDHTPQTGNQEVATTSYSVVDVCRFYLDVISKLPTRDPLEFRKSLAEYPLTLPKGGPRTYADVFNSISYFPRDHYNIYFGRIFWVFTCNDGVAVTFKQQKNGREPAIVLIPQRQLDDPRWGRTLTTLLHPSVGQSEPGLYICGHAQRQGGLHVIELEHPSWAHFDAHPWWPTANWQQESFDGTTAQLLATLSAPVEPPPGSSPEISDMVALPPVPLNPEPPEPETRSPGLPADGPLQCDLESAPPITSVPPTKPADEQEWASHSIKATGLFQRLIRLFTRK